jgi:hypothetical protein
VHYRQWRQTMAAALPTLALALCTGSLVDPRSPAVHNFLSRWTEASWVRGHAVKVGTDVS